MHLYLSVIVGPSYFVIYNLRLFLKIVTLALEVIQELQKHFQIKRRPLRIRVAAPENEVPSLLEKMNIWETSIIFEEESAGQLSVVFELEPGLYKNIHYFVMNKMHRRFEVLAHSLYVDADTRVKQYNDHEDPPAETFVSA